MKKGSAVFTRSAHVSHPNLPLKKLNFLLTIKIKYDIINLSKNKTHKKKEVLYYDKKRNV